MTENGTMEAASEKSHYRVKCTDRHGDVLAAGAIVVAVQECWCRGRGDAA